MSAFRRLLLNSFPAHRHCVISRETCLLFCVVFFQTYGIPNNFEKETVNSIEVVGSTCARLKGLLLYLALAGFLSSCKPPHPIVSAKMRVQVISFCFGNVTQQSFLSEKLYRPVPATAHPREFWQLMIYRAFYWSGLVVLSFRVCSRHRRRRKSVTEQLLLVSLIFINHVFCRRLEHFPS